MRRKSRNREPFESALIVGAGPFGLLHLLALRERGVREVAIAGRGDDRLKWAAALEPDRVIDVRAGDPEREVASLNHGFGPDLVIECTGQLDGWQQSLAHVRRGGRVVFFGGCAPGTKLNVDTRRMHYDNLTLLAPFHFRPRDVKRAFQSPRRARDSARVRSSTHGASLDRARGGFFAARKRIDP